MGETTPLRKWPIPVGSDTPNVPRDMKALGIAIENDLNGIVLGNATQPSSFVGEGRPDTDTGVHTADEWAMLQAAPPGSSYICQKPEDNLGAQVWRKGTDWVCVEGDTGWRNAIGAASQLGITVGANVSRMIVRRTALHSEIYMQNSYVSGAATWVNWNEGAEFQRWCDMHQHTTTRNSPDGVAYVGFYAVGYAYGASIGNYGTGDAGTQWVSANGLTRTLAWPTLELPPTNAIPARTLDELRELIAEIENDPDHEHHESLQQLRDELADLEGQNNA